MADTTTRAYTLKLKGDRLTLWRNHAIFNRGAKSVGEWLLNLLGGLPASLAARKQLPEIPASSRTKRVKDRIAAIALSAIHHEVVFQVATEKAIRAEVAARKNRAAEAAVRKELLAARRSELRRVVALSRLCPRTQIQLAPKI